jgi:hypothetical protein
MIIIMNARFTDLGARVLRTLCFVGIHGIATVSSAQQARDVIAEDALRQKVASAPSLKAHLEVKAKPLTNIPPSTQNSLLRNSIILADNEKYTVVPVGAILHLPAKMRSRIISQPKGDFTFWPSFLERNSQWLAAKEVSLSLSRGNAKEADMLLKSLANDNRLVVATYKGGPITILEKAPANKNATLTKP